MIQLIQGPPRSGKSYFAVNYLLKFVDFDDLYQEYILKPDVLIISNIEGLKIRHWRLDECLKGRLLEDFFSIENFEQIMAKTKKTHVILLIDEAHELFPNGFRSEKIYNFFAYHGHIGLDVVLMTQGIESLSRLFNPLLEYVVCVTQRSKSVALSFSYTYRDLKGRYLFSKVLRKDNKVFRAYKSFRQDEHNKPKNALIRWVAVIVGFFLVGGWVFSTAVGELKTKSEKAAHVSSSPKSPVPSSVKEKPLVVDNSPPVDSVSIPAGVSWRVYSVQGYSKVGGNHTFLINGRRISEDRTRNFDAELMLVEVFGLPISPPAAATAREGEEIGGGGLARQGQGEPLGEPTAHGRESRQTSLVSVAH